MPLSTPLLDYLKKGNFPLLSSAGFPLWTELIAALKNDAKKTVDEIEDAMKKASRDYDDYFSSEITVNKVDIDTGQDEVEAFLGAAHAYLSKDHGLAGRPPVQDFVQGIRKVMKKKSTLPESDVKLGMDAHHKMGNGLVANPLTCLPDAAWGVTFGSVPDQKEIGTVAPAWNILKRRAYENQGLLTQYGAKPHYVLAHLLNHNLNGSGKDPKNVIPFWATANTQMAKQAEGHVKDLVLRGAQVQYTVTVGAPVGMTPGRAALKGACNKEQWELVELEQWLPVNFVISCDAWDANAGGWVSVVNVPINNYVPETVPYLLKKT
jgi:hypothetical protein